MIRFVMSDRLKQKLDTLKAHGKKGLISFVTAGDPNIAVSQEILNGLPGAGADIIELGMAFTDPVADGPVIQNASQRALKSGINVQKTLDMVRTFREQNNDTPIVLMGYYNPVYAYGVDGFVQDAAEAGVDGLIIVDLPPEEDAELRIPAQTAGIDIIRLLTPTTDEDRLPALLDGASGFLYYVAVAGITGTKSAALEDLKPRIAAIKQATQLPVAIGFGIKTPDDARAMAALSDAVVVGSAIVNVIANDPGNAKAVLAYVNGLADAVHGVP